MRFMTLFEEIKLIRGIIDDFDPARSNRYFVFGSSVRRKKFHDIDLGVVGNGSSHKQLEELRERFYHSNLPYKVDVVDFDAADREFRDYVLHNEPIVWIR
jgi:uncharacterized protein